MNLITHKLYFNKNVIQKKKEGKGEEKEKEEPLPPTYAVSG